MHFPIMKCVVKVKKKVSKLSIIQSKFLSTLLGETRLFVFFLEEMILHNYSIKKETIGFAVKHVREKVLQGELGG